MNSEWFEKVINEQIKTCTDVLIGKAKEYATDDDRLHNFKNAAGMMGCDPKEALAGMMAKHTISIYDMCRSGKDYPIELWNEKITDHINYLLLLKAVVEEDHWHETLGNEGDKYCNKMIAEIQTEIPPVKPEIALRINQFKDQIKRCATAECRKCPYDPMMLRGTDCAPLFMQDFEKLIADVVEHAHNEPTFRGTNDGKREG